MGGVLSTAGESVANKMAENQKATMASQREAQQKMMETNMKRQVAIQMAATRERLNWQFVGWSIVTTAIGVRFAATKQIHATAAFPLVILPYLMLYQADMAYGNKMDRIKAESDRILVRGAHHIECKANACNCRPKKSTGLLIISRKLCPRVCGLASFRMTMIRSPRACTASA